MDSLFQILIFLFVIYTIFNSITGKKKPDSTNRSTPGRRSGEIESDTPPASDYSTGDVLQDLFGLKIPRTGDEYDSYARSGESAGSSPSDDPEGSGYNNMPEVDYDELPSLEVKPAAETGTENHAVYEVQRSSNLRMVELQQKLKTRQTLKELFLISEILNKPKAFRK